MTLRSCHLIIDMYFYLFAIVLQDLTVIKADVEENSDELTQKPILMHCREKSLHIGTNKTEQYSIVDAVEMETLELQCHFCKENDDQQPKIWFKQNKYNKTNHEVELGMNTNVSMNRIHITPHHTLVIQNFTENDTGLYFCHGPNGVDEEYKYNYFVDMVFPNQSIITGNLTDWRKYSEKYFKSAQKMLQTMIGENLTREGHFGDLSVEIYTEWEPWGRCNVCGRRFGDGQRKRVGQCHIKLVDKSIMELNRKGINSSSGIDKSEYICGSKYFSTLFPDFSEIIRLIPTFKQVEHCNGVCNPDSQGKSVGWKTGKTKSFKYKKIFVLAEGAHLTLICPESSLESKIIWRKDGKVLKPPHSFQSSNSTEPKVAVDSFSTLYLQDVTSNEEGNYSCFMNDIRMQMNTVFVVSKARLLTQAFLRHMIYLGFVLSLTLSCYCVGLAVAWRRRHEFKGYSEVIQI